MSRTDQLISWLNDAYTMETGLVPILQHPADDAKSDRDAAERIARHAEQTKRQAELLRDAWRSSEGAPLP